MAATSHPLATLAALEVMRSGGNAADAAVAAVAVLCVVEPQMTGIGGDCFALYAPASGGVKALNGSGRAPRRLTIDALRAAASWSWSASPHGVTIPGRRRRWEHPARAHGTRGLASCCSRDPARRGGLPGFAAGGLGLAAPPIRRRVAEAARPSTCLAAASPEAGRADRALPALARTLRRIAEQGAHAFYEGELAEKMVASLNAVGGLHEVEDFAAAAPEEVEPIHTATAT